MEERKKYRVYILTEEGCFLKPEITQILLDRVMEDAELENFGTGSAYNMPVYLLGEIEDHEDTAMVIAWDMDEDQPHPRFLVGEDEIRLLIDVLENNQDGDSWEIAVEVNKAIRGR